MPIILFLIFLLLPSLSFSQDTRQFPTMTLLQLEKAYWICDYVSSLRTLNSNEVTFCVEITKEMNSRKFNSNWDEYVKWRNLNKDAEFKKLESK